ncbi:MAG: hypothetical protein AAGU02_00535 [Lawsonibacter sp.]
MASTAHLVANRVNDSRLQIPNELMGDLDAALLVRTVGVTIKHKAPLVPFDIQQFRNLATPQEVYAQLGLLLRLESGEITSVSQIKLNPTDHETRRFPFL